MVCRYERMSKQEGKGMRKPRLFINGVCVGATPTRCSIDTEPAEHAETPKYTKSVSLKVQISPEAKEMLEAEIAKSIRMELLFRSYVYEHADETHQEAAWVEAWHCWAFHNCLNRETVRKIFDSYNLYPKKQKQ